MSVSPCVFDWDGEREARNQADTGKMTVRKSFVDDADFCGMFKNRNLSGSLCSCECVTPLRSLTSDTVCT